MIHFWGSNSGPEHLVEVRFLGRTICIPEQNRRVPRSSRFYPVARKTAPLGSYGRFKLLAISRQPVTDSALRLAPISLRIAIRARTRPNMIMTAPRHRRHRESIGDFRYRSASGAQGRVCLVSMRTYEHICIVIIRCCLIVPRLIPPAQIARSYAYFRCSDFQFAISDSDRDFRFQIKLSDSR